MLRYLAIPLALVSLAAAGCSSTTVETSADPHHATPAWLVGTLDGGMTSSSAYTGTSSIVLDADGTAQDKARTINNYDPYKEPEDVSFGYKWWVDGDTFHMDSLTYTMSVTAGCHLVQLTPTSGAYATTYAHGTDHGEIAGCPYPETPLTDAEQPLVGEWTTHDDDHDLFINFASDRTVYFNNGLNTTYFRFELDPDGTTMYGTTPDGTYIATPRLTLTPGHLRWCDQDGCVMLSTYSP